MIPSMQKTSNIKLKLIKSEKDYDKALKRLDKIFYAKVGSKEQEELEILVLLIEKYETELVGEFQTLTRLRPLNSKWSKWT